MENSDKLRHKVEQQANRMQQAESDQDSLVAQTIYLGTLAILFVLPVIGGAYLGNWLDNMAAGYSYKWSVGLIALGVGVGVFNVYMFVREHG